jgi:hypothetical protein
MNLTAPFTINLDIGVGATNAIVTSAAGAYALAIIPGYAL